MKEEIKTRIGKMLLKLRTIDNDMRLTELAKKSGVDKNTISKYENGQGNSFDTLAKILSVYDLDISYFFKMIYDSMQNEKEEV